MISQLKSIVLVASTLFLATSAWGQTASNQSNNPYTRTVRKDDIMFKKSLWFRVDCRQKMNSSFFSQGKEISKVLIDAVEAGLILPYTNDNLTTRMTKEQFTENLKLPLQNEQEDPFFNNDDFDLPGDTSTWGVNEAPVAEKAPDTYFPNQLWLFELKEDLLFDKHESRMKHDIQTISLIIPAEVNQPAGLDKVVGVFSYDELVEKVFMNNPDAIWYNPQNSAAHLNLADAFTLRMFNGQLVKYENPKNNMIVDLYSGGKRALVESERAIMQLMEYEALLWEY